MELQLLVTAQLQLAGCRHRHDWSHAVMPVNACFQHRNPTRIWGVLQADSSRAACHAGFVQEGSGSPTGTPLTNPPLVELLSEDPVLRNTKLIAEAWDCDGLNQVPTPAPQPIRQQAGQQASTGTQACQRGLSAPPVVAHHYTVQ